MYRKRFNWNILLIDLAHDTINSFLTGFIITIKQRRRVSVKMLMSKLLLG